MTSQRQKAGVAVPFSNIKRCKKSKITLLPLSTDSSSAASSSFDDPQIYSCFKDTYMHLENRIILHLDNLVERNPFCDVVFTGHSFGGALAQIAAVRYATA